MPLKPNKFGIQIILFLDKTTKYMMDAHMGGGSINIYPAEEYYVRISNNSRQIQY